MSLNGRMKNDYIEKNRKIQISTNDEEDDEDIESAVDDDTD